jgi:DNA primase
MTEVKPQDFLSPTVDAGVAKLLGSTWPWQSWLDGADHHGKYGVANTLLIGQQMKDATTVLPYEEWQARGRQVVKGEQAIRILSVRGNSRPVFDLSQTTGEPQPQAPDRSPEQTWACLVKLAASRKLFVDRGSRWNYLGDPAARIPVDPALTDHQAAEHLAHQLAHLELHQRICDGDCAGVLRVEADSVAYLVLRHLRADPSMEFPPVASWAGEDERSRPLGAVMVVCGRVLRTAFRLRSKLDALPAEASAQELSKNLVVPTERDEWEEHRQELLAIHEAAQALFIAERPGSWMPSYLAERGFDQSVQEQWQLGHAPAGWRTLAYHLSSLGFSDEAILASGLARQAKAGHLYDAFRDRVMFPLRDSSGAILGFIGRTSVTGTGPKYLNSPETPLFKKRELLYGLYESRDLLATGARPIIVEGPLDAIACHLAGHPALSPCGTTLSPQQAGLLGEYGAVLALDGDAAGRRGAVHAWRSLSQVKGAIGAVVFPENQDPAEILSYQGNMAVHEALQSEVPLADVVVDAAIERYGDSLEFVESQLAAARAAASVIAQMRPADVARQVARVASRLAFEPTDITRYVISAIAPTALADGDFPSVSLTGPEPAATSGPASTISATKPSRKP